MIPILGSIFLTPVFVALSVLIGVVTAVAGGGSIERERKTIAHTWIAGRPQSGSLRTTYTGDVSRKTSRLLLFVLPVMTLALALLISAFVL